MTHARIELDPAATVGRVSPRLFGTFVEHMGRCVYDGIHAPEHPSADADGFRTDVADLVRELGATVVRYPGGNFVSGFEWEDSVGPRDERPVRLDAAWHSVETNQVGLHEFASWAQRVGLELMMAVNLGTRGPRDAARLLEYCNFPAGTALSDERRANGAEDPFGIRLWCLGNEMDGDWQIGHKTAHEYGRIAAETARLMRFVDPGIELVVAGSSSAGQPTFGSWEREVVRQTAGLVEHISLHAYYEELDGDLDSFLASGVGLDRYIEEVAGILAEEEAALGLERPLGISVDEWNVWYQTRFNEQDKEPLLTGEWAYAPAIIEDEYAVADAVVVGSLLNSLLRHADRVTMANQAQLVNVIAPIRTEPDAAAWRQTIFWPFAITAARARGEALRIAVDAPLVSTAAYGDVPSVDVAGTVDGDRVELFLVNRDHRAPVEVTLGGAGQGFALAGEALVLTVPEGRDRFATNTRDEQPVRPTALPVREVAGEVLATLPALSWAAVSLTVR
ncbi:alpha-N-arabinofuranosidase [Oerskovia flava]|uniref:alpha-N-arabinofuranosidase n=1 Tax=Oerskovia flava TaxID=2986422 RepID=UPI00223F9D3A|nr:alpha-L-arabinofuranosidase C-terminal domain-containing protein [Oerskovia sp. JB1-3-2]